MLQLSTKNVAHITSSFDAPSAIKSIEKNKNSSLNLWAIAREREREVTSIQYPLFYDTFSSFHSFALLFYSSFARSRLNTRDYSQNRLLYDLSSRYSVSLAIWLVVSERWCCYVPSSGVAPYNALDNITTDPSLNSPYV
jgi:hypothetical protein